MTVGILLAIFLLDQFSKLLILKSLSLGESIPVLPPLFHLTLIHNTGIAFGLFQGWSSLLFWVNLVILVGLLFMIGRRHFKRPLLQIGIGMVTGGALGNLVDRLRFGYIVDFLDLHVWPVFNLADSAICIGTGLLLLSLFSKTKDTELRTKNPT